MESNSPVVKKSYWWMKYLENVDNLKKSVYPPYMSVYEPDDLYDVCFVWEGRAYCAYIGYCDEYFFADIYVLDKGDVCIAFFDNLWWGGYKYSPNRISWDSFSMFLQFLEQYE